MVCRGATPEWRAGRNRESRRDKKKLNKDSKVSAEHCQSSLNSLPSKHNCRRRGSQTPASGHSLTGGTEQGVCEICVEKACADARHTNDTYAFPQTTLLLCKNQGLLFACHREKTYPPLRSPLLKVPDTNQHRRTTKRRLQLHCAMLNLFPLVTL